MGVKDHTNDVFWPDISEYESSVTTSIVMMQQPITTMQFSWTFKPGSLPQILQDTCLEVRVNTLTLWDKLMVNKTIDTKKHNQHGDGCLLGCSAM
jgi:hypothetical protein